MEVVQKNNDLRSFIEERQKKTLAIAQNFNRELVEKMTKEIVDTENALMDFEIMLAVNMPDKEKAESVAHSRKLREESWKELEEKFNGDYGKIMEFLDAL